MIEVDFEYQYKYPITNLLTEIKANLEAHNYLEALKNAEGIKALAKVISVYAEAKIRQGR